MRIREVIGILLIFSMFALGIALDATIIVILVSLIFGVNTESHYFPSLLLLAVLISWNASKENLGIFLPILTKITTPLVGKLLGFNRG